MDPKGDLFFLSSHAILFLSPSLAGLNPSQSALARAFEEFDDPDHPDTVGFRQLVQIYDAFKEHFEPVDAEVLLDAMKVMDPHNQGTLPLDALKKLVEDFGEELTDIEVSDLVTSVSSS